MHCYVVQNVMLCNVIMQYSFMHNVCMRWIRQMKSGPDTNPSMSVVITHIYIKLSSAVGGTQSLSSKSF